MHEPSRPDLDELTEALFGELPSPRVAARPAAVAPAEPPPSLRPPPISSPTPPAGTSRTELWADARPRRRWGRRLAVTLGLLVVVAAGVSATVVFMRDGSDADAVPRERTPRETSTTTTTLAVPEPVPPPDAAVVLEPEPEAPEPASDSAADDAVATEP